MANDWVLKLETADLRKMFDAVLTHVEKSNGTTLSIPPDDSWSIPVDDTFDLGNDPVLTIGALSNSWEFLTDSVKGDYVVSHATVWLAELLKAIGHYAKP